MDFLGPYRLGPNEDPEQGIYCGDARVLAEQVPDESVDLIFTDPIYERIEDYEWLALTAMRVLKPDSAALVWEGQQWLDQAMEALKRGGLSYRWALGWYASNNMQMVGLIGRKIAPLLWYEKGHSNPVKAVREIKESPIPDGKTPFKWAKRVDVVAYYLERFTRPGAVVLDVFGGSGSLAVAAKELRRQYVCFEEDLGTAELARGRVSMAQPAWPEMTAALQATLGV